MGEQSESLCCISWRGSVAEVSAHTDVMYTVRMWQLSFLCTMYITQSPRWHTETWQKYWCSHPRWKVNPSDAPQHPSPAHLHLVDVGWVVPAAAELSGSLTAAVRHRSAVCVSGANPDALSPVRWTVAATALELTGDRGEDILRGEFWWKKRSVKSLIWNITSCFTPMDDHFSFTLQWNLPVIFFFTNSYVTRLILLWYLYSKLA